MRRARSPEPLASVAASRPMSTAVCSRVSRGSRVLRGCELGEPGQLVVAMAQGRAGFVKCAFLAVFTGFVTPCTGIIWDILGSLQLKNVGVTNDF